MVEHVPNCEDLIRGEVVSQRALFKEHDGKSKFVFQPVPGFPEMDFPGIFFLSLSDIIGENSLRLSTT